MEWLSSSLRFFLFFLVFYSQILFSSSSSSSSYSGGPQCHPDEHSALVQLNSSFSVYTSPFGCLGTFRTAYWNKSTNCCTWSGITCDRVTGHVIGLDLSCSRIQATISSNSSLFFLRHLRILDLSDNDFQGSPVLSEFGQFKYLTNFYLYDSNFRGHIPLEISHLSNLVSFAVGQDEGNKIRMEAVTFKALAQNITNLSYLTMVGIDMSSIPLVSLLNFSSSLIKLRLRSCELLGRLPENIFQWQKLQVLDLSDNEAITGSFPNSNLSSSLTTLDLSNTSFTIDLPLLLNNARSLSHLSLRSCHFVGSYPALVGNFTQIVSLDLSYNNFSGQIPWSSFNHKHIRSLYLSFNNFIGQLPEVYYNSTENFSSSDSSRYLVGSVPSSLSYLKLSNNLLNGTIPTWIYALPNLASLDLGNNLFMGEIAEFHSSSLYTLLLGKNNLVIKVEHLEKLSKLKELWNLDLSSNNLSLSFNNSMNFTFDNLRSLDLSSCNISVFPNFLKSSKSLQSLDLSRNQITGNAPKWFSEVGKNTLRVMNLSHNFITYIMPLPWKSLLSLDIRSNLFSGPLPISSSLNLAALLASKNQFMGEIPISFCNMTFLRVLDLSYNNLSGKIPQCIMRNFSEYLSVLDLRKNKFRGAIPTTFGKGNTLRNLNLNGNQLEGPLPRTLVHCRNLEVLDLGNNLLNDTFPYWLESLPKLQVLVLRSNKFHGSIEDPLVSHPFPQLRIMDLSYNEFSGALPTKYFQNFKAMMNVEKVKMTYMGELFYQDSVMVTMKGLFIELLKIQTILTTIDFSRNNFTGEIPKVIGKLQSLKGLNFSQNKLRGTIPSSLGNLTNLEWLDLSSNELVGKIPVQLADVPWLSFLNLSYNQLVGPIPQGKQFNTFRNDSFAENVGLCGFQVSKTCNRDLDAQPSPPTFEQESDDSEDKDGFNWKIIMMGYGSGLVIGISMGYILLNSDGKLGWLCEKIVGEQQRKRVRRPNKHLHARR